MRKFFKAVSTLLAVITAAAFIIPFAACTPDPDTNGEVIRVYSVGGIPLTDVTVTVLNGNTQVGNGKTNDKGEYAFKVDGDNYTAVLSDLPEGYTAKSSYKLNKNKQNVIYVESGIITDKPIPAGKQYSVGDILYDFELQNAYNYENATDTSLAAKKVKLSELFEGKKAILLNFFFVSCGPCNSEMPAILSAYEKYKDDIVIIGLDNQGDSDADVANFVLKHQANYYMSVDTAGVIASFPKVNAFPTNIVIDRYGVICEREANAHVEESYWLDLFERYSSDDYSSNIKDDNDGSIQIDKPADFGVFFSDEGMNEAVNKTNSNVTFSATDPKVDDTVWPWKVSDDKQSLVVTNSGHYSTRAILNVRVTIPAGSVLAFEYKLDGASGYDYLFVAVDSKGGLGTQTFEDSGKKDWTTGYAYMPLEAGSHVISFAYYKTSTDKQVTGQADAAFIRNLHFVTTEEFVANSDPMDIPYYAARGNTIEGGYAIYEDVVLEDDGFYHVTGRQSSKGDNPMLYVDLLNAVPFFTDATHTASIYSEFLAKNDCKFLGTDYRDKLDSYSSWAVNSSVSNLVPVNEDVRKMLDDIYVDRITRELGYEDFWDPDNGWKEFCVFFVHYGDGNSLGNSIEGIAPFTAYEAHETTGLTDTSGNLNTAIYDRILMPRGYLFKFVPEKSGVYEIKAINSLNESGKPISMGKDGAIYDGRDFKGNYYQTNLNINEVNNYGSDVYVRNKPEDFDHDNVNFDMHHYMEAGVDYFIWVAFSTVENLGKLEFRIDYLDVQHYEYLTSATSGYIVAGQDNKYYRPIYTNIELNDEGIYIDSTLKKPIYCDFTDVSRMFNRYPISTLLGLTGNQKFEKDPFDLRVTKKNESGQIIVDKDGKPVLFEEDIVINGETFRAKNYTEEMKQYYQKAILKTGDLYGLQEVDETLRAILIMFYHANIGLDDPQEWLTACWYFDFTDATKPQPNTVLFPYGVNKR